MKTVKVVCASCGNEFDKRVADYNRTEKRGRRHFCSLGCAAIVKNKEFPSDSSCAVHLDAGNRRDKHTPFRWFVLRARQRRAKKGDTDLSVEYLRELWDEQGGVCPQAPVTRLPAKNP